MRYNTIQVGSFAVNCSIVCDGDGLWVIDPGSESEYILTEARAFGLDPSAILLTHAHFDHIGGIAGLQAAYPELPVYVHPGDIAAFTHPMNSYPPDYPPAPKPRNLVSALGFKSAVVIETPGHTPGGVCYHFKDAGLLFSGDTLFAGSIGRTDLPGGDMATLAASLEKLKALPPETIVIPGHGSSTTIGTELRENPFLK